VSAAEDVAQSQLQCIDPIQYDYEVIRPRLLLDSRVVDVPMAYNPTWVIFSSLNPLFFNNLKNESCFSDHVGA